VTPHHLRSPLEAALYYLSLGWSPLALYPPEAKVKRPGKQPIGRWEQWQHQHPYAEDLEALWAKHPGANVGIALGPVSGLVGIDLDGEEGLRLFLEWAEDETRIPATIAFATPNHGRRLLYALPEGVELPTRRFDVNRKEAVRLLGHGSQTVMPPSRLKNGEYAWLSKCAPWEQPVGLCPDWLLARFQEEDRQGGGGPVLVPDRPHRPEAVERARLYLRRSDPAISGLGGHDQAIKIADKIAVGFDLDDDTALAILWEEWNPHCRPPWSKKELAHKIAEARKTTLRRPGYLLQEERSPHSPASFPVSIPAQPMASETGNRKQPVARYATAADLIAASAELRWIWDSWIPQGLLVALAAEPGCGKTRLCGDLARRIYHGLPWPDGMLSTLPPRTPTLWVASDNQHPQLVEICREMDIPPEAMFFSTAHDDPFGGTMLDQAEDLQRLEAAIRIIKPGLVFIDTTLNSTDRGCTKPEDAKAFFVPLMEIARRTATAILCVTHLNASGKALGLRIRGQCRVVWHLSLPDPAQENRRRLWVDKSLAKYPPPLGVTMLDNRNDYDDAPPSAPGEEPAERKPARFDELAAWLRDTLLTPRRVSWLRDEAEKLGFSSKTLYKARKEGIVEEYEEGGRTFWRLK
jgi:hypothetical protein